MSTVKEKYLTAGKAGIIMLKVLMEVTGRDGRYGDAHDAV